jgi:hypothetical protein
MTPAGRSVIRLLGDGTLHPCERDSVTWLASRWKQSGRVRTPAAPFYARRASASLYDLWLWEEHEVPAEQPWHPPRRNPESHLMRRCLEEFIQMGLARAGELADPQQTFVAVVARHQEMRALEVEAHLPRSAPDPHMRPYRGVGSFGYSDEEWPATVVRAERRSQSLIFEVKGGTREGYPYRSECSLALKGKSASGKGETFYPDGQILRVESIELAVRYDSDGCLELAGTWKDEGEEETWEFALDLEQIGS